MTMSSQRGDYVHAVIQVTRDMVPVVFFGWTLPFNGAVDLGVADLTLVQLLRLAEKENLVLSAQHHRPTSASEWARTLNTRLIPLKDLLQVSVNLIFKRRSSIEICLVPDLASRSGT